MKRFAAILCFLLPGLFASANNILTLTLNPPSTGYTPHQIVQTYHTNLLLNGGDIASEAGLSNINNFIIAGTNSYITNLLDGGIFWGSNTNSRDVKLIYQSNTSSNVAVAGGITFWSNSIGVIGNGSSVYVNTRFFMTNTSGSAKGMTTFVTRPEHGITSSPWSVLMGYHDALFTFLGVLNGGEENSDIYESSQNFGIGVGVPFPKGKAGVGSQQLIRIDSTHAYIFHNGVNWGQSSSSASADNPNRQPFILAMNDSGSPNYYSTASVGAYFIDNGMPTNVIPIFHTNLATLMRTLGRMDYPKKPRRTILAVGQSLGTGFGSGTSVVQPVSPFENYMSANIVNAGTWNSDLFRFKAARSVSKEGVAIADYKTSGWPAMQDQITYMATNDNGAGHLTNTSFFMGWAVGGDAYGDQKKGSTTIRSNIFEAPVYTNTYEQVLMDWRYQNDFEQRYFGSTLNFSAIFSVFGESDNGSSTFGTDMINWRSNYINDVGAILGTTNQNLVMYHSQQGSYTNQISNTNMLWLHVNHYGSNQLVGPKYQFAYTDGTHLTNKSYMQMGELYGKFYYRREVLGQTIDPLYITNVNRTAASIVLTYSGNVGNITIADPPGGDPGNKGFIYTDDSSPPSISSVSATAANQVTITLSGTPTGANKRLWYAWPLAAMRNNEAGTNSPRGCIRDSDTAIGFTTTSNLYNWAVHQGPLTVN